MIRKDGCDFCTQCGHVGLELVLLWPRRSRLAWRDQCRAAAIRLAMRVNRRRNSVLQRLE